MTLGPADGTLFFPGGDASNSVMVAKAPVNQTFVSSILSSMCEANNCPLSHCTADLFEASLKAFKCNGQPFWQWPADVTLQAVRMRRRMSDNAPTLGPEHTPLLASDWTPRRRRLKRRLAVQPTGSSVAPTLGGLSKAGLGRSSSKAINIFTVPDADLVMGDWDEAWDCGMSAAVAGGSWWAAGSTFGAGTVIAIGATGQAVKACSGVAQSVVDYFW